MSDGLAHRAWQAVRSAAAAVSGAANYLARVTPATRLTWVGRLVERVRPATRITFSPSSLVVPQRPATRVSPLYSGALKDLARPATRIGHAPATLKVPQRPATRISHAPALLTIQQRPATNIVEVFATGSHTSWVVTAVQVGGGTGTWQNPTNLQGPAQGTQGGSSTFAGGLVLGTGRLRGNAMVAQPNRSYVIDSVWLRYHYQTIGLPVVSDLISQLAAGFRINSSPLPGVEKDVVVITSNDDFLVAGREFRIDDGAGKFIDGANPAVSTAVTWANIALLQPYFSATTIANGLMTYYADAIRLRVEFHDTAAL